MVLILFVQVLKKVLKSLKFELKYPGGTLHTQHLKVQSKGRERGKDNKNTKVTPLNNHVHSVKNTAKPQWLKAWPHRLAPLYTHMRQFAGGYGSNMPLYTCVV